MIRRIMTMGVVFAIGAVAAVALVRENYIVLGVLVFLPIIVAMLARVTVAIYGSLVSIFLLEWLSSSLHVLPRPLTWLPELFSLALLMRIVLDLGLNRIHARHNFVIYFVYGWTALGIVGAVANSIDPLVALAGFRNYFKFMPLLFALSWYSLSEQTIRRVVYAVIGISLAQIVFTVSQRMIYWEETGDVITGSLGAGSSGTLAVFQLMVFSMLAFLWRDGYFGSKVFLACSGVVLLPTFVTEAKVTFYLLPLLCLLLLMRPGKQQRAVQTLLLLVFAVSAILVGGYVYNKIYGSRLTGGSIQGFVLSSSRSQEEVGYRGQIVLDKGGGLRRFSAVLFMLDNIQKIQNATIVGVGIGNASDSFIIPSRGIYFEKYAKLRIDSVFLSRLGWEFGYPGMILFFIFLCRLFLLKPAYPCTPFYAGMLSGVQGLVIIVAACSFYNSVLTWNALAFMFWLHLGIVNGWLLAEEGQLALLIVKRAGIA